MGGYSPRDNESPREGTRRRKPDGAHRSLRNNVYCRAFDKDEKRTAGARSPQDARDEGHLFARALRKIAEDDDEPSARMKLEK